MNNLVSLNNMRVGLVFDEKTHCFQGYNQGYRKTSNN